MEISGQLHASVALTRGKGSRITSEQDAGWTPQAVWKLRKKKLLAPARESNTDSLVKSVA